MQTTFREGQLTDMSLADLHLIGRTAKLPRHCPRVLALWLTGAMVVTLLSVFALSVVAWSPMAVVSLPLVLLAATWISGGAATALLGQITPQQNRRNPLPGWRPDSRTAVLVTLCKEDPEPLARHLVALQDGMARLGLAGATDIFVLSDTYGTEDIAREEAAFRPLTGAGNLHYRRRAHNIGRKPGNIGDWLDREGDAYDYMLVLDADSRMSPARIRDMIWQMDLRKDLGLLQVGISIRPGRTRFGRHQRVAARLLSRSFGLGFAAWSGDSGNYWGHNAIMRVAAFRAARDLPVLSGRAPWGGSILSHDFVEAAWIRRAGWAVVLDPVTAGSAEDAPQTVEAFHARDRRWCQGNLQHLRLTVEPGMDAISRVHLAMGILSYLVAPIWLMLVLLVAFGGVTVKGIWPLLAVVAVLLVPKLCALIEWWRVARTPHRRATVLRASLGELAVSSIVAPLVMLRQAGAVLSVALGQDCGWKTGRTQRKPSKGLPEALTGIALVSLAVGVSGFLAIWLAPITLSLCFAPAVVRYLDAPV